MSLPLLTVDEEGYGLTASKAEARTRTSRGYILLLSPPPLSLPFLLQAGSFLVLSSF